MPIVRCLIISAIFSLAGLASAQTDDSGFSHAGIKAKPIERGAPNYPVAERRKNRQGWVELSYVVTPQGRVIDPVVENSSGSVHFENAALRAARKWRFEPATWDGTPVQQCDTKVRVVFAFEDSGTLVSRKFFNQYKRIEKQLNKGHLDKAEKGIKDAFEIPHLTLSEVSWLWAISSRLAAKKGDTDAQLAALSKATSLGENWIDEKLYPSLLTVKAVREIEKARLSDAFLTFAKLEDIGTESKHIDALRNSIKKVKGVVASQEVLSVPGEIESGLECENCESNWQYRPLRRKFHLADIDGDLDHIEIRCDWTRVTDPAMSDKSWELPAEWGDCKVFVFGQPGATFDFVEEPST